jgi:hypothetical protein
MRIEEKIQLPIDITLLFQMFHNNVALVHKFGFKFIGVANEAVKEMLVALANEDLPVLEHLDHKLNLLPG